MAIDTAITRQVFELHNSAYLISYSFSQLTRYSRNDVLKPMNVM